MVKISIILPTINEEQGIGPTLDAIPTTYFEKKGWEYEMVIVDGDSSDKTQAIAKKRGHELLFRNENDMAEHIKQVCHS